MIQKAAHAQPHFCPTATPGSIDECLLRGMNGLCADPKESQSGPTELLSRCPLVGDEQTSCSRNLRSEFDLGCVKTRCM
jgi:hypothetical protein